MARSRRGRSHSLRLGLPARRFRSVRLPGYRSGTGASGSSFSGRPMRRQRAGSRQAQALEEGRRRHERASGIESRGPAPLLPAILLGRSRRSGAEERPRVRWERDSVAS